MVTRELGKELREPLERIVTPPPTPTKSKLYVTTTPGECCIRQGRELTQ